MCLYNALRMSFISFISVYSSKSAVYISAIPIKSHGNYSRLRELQRHVLCCTYCYVQGLAWSDRHPLGRKRIITRKTIREGANLRSDNVWPDTCNANVNKGWQFAILTPHSWTSEQISHTSDGFKRLGGSRLQLYPYMNSYVEGVRRAEKMKKHQQLNIVSQLL